jgi:DNA-binding MarR family transcriptional regulator
MVWMTKDDQLYAVLAQIRPVFRAVVGAVEEGLSGTGLGVPERGVLECLDGKGPFTVAAMARLIGVPRQFVQRTCNGLLARGLVEKLDNPAHARSDLIHMTRAGRRTFAALRARETAASKPLAAALSASDLTATGRVLRAMQAHYEALTEERN